MKKLLYILLFVPIVGFNQYTTIPDQNFEQALIDLGYDNVLDGQILTSNISSLNYLNISNLNIQSLTGIEDFITLTNLNCSDNQIDSLNLINNTILSSLECGDNQLISLVINNNVTLNYLSCSNNQLTNLDISQNINLESLWCRASTY